MVQPSEQQKVEGLRCSRELVVFPGAFGSCTGLLLELDPEEGLGRRCGKRECRGFHPLPGLLREAAKQGMITREAILTVLKKVETREEDEMISTAVDAPELEEEQEDSPLSLAECRRLILDEEHALRAELIDPEKWAHNPQQSKSLENRLGSLRSFEACLHTLFEVEGMEVRQHLDNPNHDHHGIAFALTWVNRATNENRTLCIYLAQMRFAFTATRNQKEIFESRRSRRHHSSRSDYLRFVAGRGSYDSGLTIESDRFKWKVSFHTADESFQEF